MKNQERISSIIRLVKSKKYGEVISHQELLKATGLEYECQKYRRAISLANIELTKEKRRIENIYKVGYKVINPDEYSIASRNKFASGAKKIQESRYIIENTPMSKLNAKQKKEVNNYKERLVNFMATFEKDKNAILKYEGPIVTKHSDRIKIRF